MSPVPVVQQPNLADKGKSDEGVILKDFVVVPTSQESPSGSTSESHENEDLDCYSDAQLKALLDEAITYKTPKGQEVDKTTDKDAEESAAQPQEEEQQENKDPEPKGKEDAVKVDKVDVKNDPPTKNPFIPGSWGPSFRTIGTIDPKSFAGPRDYSFCPRSTHTFGMPGMCCYSPAPNVPEVVKVRKERNAIIRNSHEIDGYRGSDNIDSLVRFIESSDSEQDHKKGGGGGKKPIKISGSSKKAKKAAPPQQKLPPKPKPKEIIVQKIVEKPPERMPEIQTSDDLSGKVSPTIEGSEFRVVMKKKKKPKN